MIVLNEKARQKRPEPPPKPTRAKNIVAYLVATSPNEYGQEIYNRLKAAKDQGVPVNLDAHNLDSACTWYHMPEGPEFWSQTHAKLEEKWYAQFH